MPFIPRALCSQMSWSNDPLEFWNTARINVPEATLLYPKHLVLRSDCTSPRYSMKDITRNIKMMLNSG